MEMRKKEQKTASVGLNSGDIVNAEMRDKAAMVTGVDPYKAADEGGENEDNGNNIHTGQNSQVL